MVALMLVFIAVGGYVGGQQGMMIAFLLAAGMNLFSYFFSDKLVLKQYNAIPVDESNAHGLYEIVSRLTQKAKFADAKKFTSSQKRCQMPLPQAAIQATQPLR